MHMALGSENSTHGKDANWREVVSAIKEAGKAYEKAPDYYSLRYLKECTLTFGYEKEKNQRKK